MKGRWKALLLILGISLTSVRCDVGPLFPTDGTVSFSVEIGNIGSTSLTYAVAPSAQVSASLSAGARVKDSRTFTGQDGTVFTFTFFVSGAKPAIGTCTLQNAELLLVFIREVDYNPDTGTVHCNNWD